MMQDPIKEYAFAVAEAVQSAMVQAASMMHQNGSIGSYEWSQQRAAMWAADLGAIIAKIDPPTLAHSDERAGR